jgi:DNA-binding transcriptional regulator YhcF (GntR family)
VFLVRSGRVGAGTRLPAVRLLAKELGLNRNASARAYTELLRRGYATREQGRPGLFVEPPRNEGHVDTAFLAAATLLAGPVRACVALGLSPEQIRRIARARADAE